MSPREFIAMAVQSAQYHGWHIEIEKSLDQGKITATKSAK